ncbi:MAG: ATP-grasp domain-containing protein [Legionella sp.]|nr:ATP-grasp domain-containing protein [Legionella sp.]
MCKLETFITQKFRPDVLGGKLDKEHKVRFMLVKGDHKVKYPILMVNAICFGPKKDNVLINLEHAINKSDNIMVLYYEDIHLRWTYINTNNDSYFLYKKNDDEQYIIKPNFLYIRGCYVDAEDKYWRILGDFYNFVDLWEGNVLCPPKKQMSNESKPYQLNNSLLNASKNHPSISIGKSYIVKGMSRYNLLEQDKSYVVKSLSGVRSRVVDETDFKNWNFRSIENIPVLFQDKIDGNDLRAHVINKHVFAKLSRSKTNIDYRYDKNFFNMQDIDNLDETLLDFCITVAKEEDNDLLGIDFVKTKSGYVVLEANPSPGWSAYHPHNGIDNEPFVIELLKVLKSG